MICRMWHGRTPRSKADAYASFLDRRAIPDYRSVPGNISVAVLRRDEDTVTHFLTVTHWASENSIRAFAGNEPLRAKYYPEDKDFLLEFEELVQHYTITAHADAVQQSAPANMPTNKTLEQFIARVEQNAHAEAVEEFYTDQSSMQENQYPPRVGRDKHVAAERNVMSRAKSISSQCVRPIFVNGNNVVIRWIFTFEWHDGTVTHMEELAYQRWEGERIAEETFFYDPAQRIPRRI